MSAVEDANIVNDTSSKKFIFRALAPLKNRKAQPPIEIPFISRSGTANILFKYSGQIEEISFTFAIFDDGTDVSSGTDASSPTTVTEQIEYLRDVIYTPKYDDTFTLTQSRYYPNGIKGLITSLDFDNPAGAGTIVIGSLIFKPGKLLTV